MENIKEEIRLWDRDSATYSLHTHHLSVIIDLKSNVRSKIVQSSKSQFNERENVVISIKLENILLNYAREYTECLQRLARNSVNFFARARK